jgi:tRNA pseudouridine55 synthase
MTDGVWLVDKPVGPTSHDIVATVRGQFPRKTKVGHAGTLDPFASGLLVVMVGRATRIAQYLVGLDKTYEARVCLGATSNTGDLTGTITQGGAAPDPARIAEVLTQLTGRQSQRVHAFSAVKVDGERLYEKARRGDVVDAPSREIIIYSLEEIDRDPELAWIDIRVRCSSGTYIRTLAEDIGSRLGCGGYCERLRRTAVGIHGIVDALAAEVVSTQAGLPMASAVSHLPQREVSDEDATYLHHGRPVAARPGDQSPIGLTRGGNLLAVGRVEAELIKPEVVLA